MATIDPGYKLTPLVSENYVLTPIPDLTKWGTVSGQFGAAQLLAEPSAAEIDVTGGDYSGGSGSSTDDGGNFSAPSQPTGGDTYTSEQFMRFTRTGTASDYLTVNVSSISIAHDTYNTGIQLRITNASGPVSESGVDLEILHGNTSSGEVYKSSTVTIPADGAWHDVAGSFTSPSAASDITLAVYTSGGAVGTQYDIRRPYITSNGGTYFTGDTYTDHGPGRLSQWAGTVNDSPSLVYNVIPIRNEGIELDVYRYSAPTVKVDTLNMRLAPTYLDEIKGPGGGQANFQMNDPKLIADPTLLDYRNIIKCKVDGNTIGAWMVQNKTPQIIGTDASQETIAVTGETMRTWLNDAVVYPELGLKSDSTTSRAFNFSTVTKGSWYTQNTWTTPVVQKAFTSTAQPWAGFPTGWPSTANSASWIWGVKFSGSGTAAQNALGDNYFRYTFTTTGTGVDYTIYLAVDDSFELYVDGQQIAATSVGMYNTYQVANQFDVNLDSGTHVIGIKATNGHLSGANPTGGGPAAVLMALFNGSTLVGTSGATSAWTVCAYPATPPAWSVGAVILQLFSEATARGVKFPSYLTPTFTAATDSYGVAWPHDMEWSFGIGDSYESVISTMEQTSCDIWIDPDTFELNAAPNRGVDRSVYGPGTPVPSYPILKFEKGKNLLESSVSGVSAVANSLVMLTTSGFTTAKDTSASATIYGTLESYYDTGVNSTASQSVASTIFADKANPEEGTTYNIVPVPGYIPFVDFQAGDYVLAPDEQLLPIKRRIMSLSLAVDPDTGRPTYTAEFDTIFQDNETKLTQYLEKLASGSLGISSATGNSGSSATSGIGAPVIVKNPPAVIYTPTAPANLSATTDGVWDSAGITPYGILNLDWDDVTTNTDGSATIPTSYDVWGKLTSDPDVNWTSLTTVVQSQATIFPFAPGSEWQFKVRAFNGSQASAFSAIWDQFFTGPQTPLDAPTDPQLQSDSGLIFATWDGLLNETANHPPDPQFRYVYAEVSPTGLNTWTQMGQALQRGGGTINISGLIEGNSYDVRFTAVDGAGISSAKSNVVTTAVSGIDLGDLGQSIFYQTDAPDPTEQTIPDGATWFDTDDGYALYTYDATNQVWNPGLFGTDALDDLAVTDAKISNLDGGKINAGSITSYQIAAQTITADNIAAGTITTDEVTSDFGSSIDLSGNGTIQLIVNGDPDDPDAPPGLRETQEYYTFTEDGAVISTPDSPFSVEISNTQISMIQAGTVVSYWNNGMMVVPQLQSPNLVMGNHQIVRYGTGTVVRALS